MASARAFVHSLNILVKYVRLYGFDHDRTRKQFEVTWAELQQGLPASTENGFLLGYAGWAEAEFADALQRLIGLLRSAQRG